MQVLRCLQISLEKATAVYWKGTKNLCSSVYGNVITTRSDDPKNVMGDHGYWIRQGQWFLRWHETKGELELFDLDVDLRNNNDVSADHPEVVEQLWAELKNYKAEKVRTGA